MSKVPKIEENLLEDQQGKIKSALFYYNKLIESYSTHFMWDDDDDEEVAEIDDLLKGLDEVSNGVTDTGNQKDVAKVENWRKAKNYVLGRLTDANKQTLERMLASGALEMIGDIFESDVESDAESDSE